MGFPAGISALSAPASTRPAMRLPHRITEDPRGTRYVVIGSATDLETQVGVVVRFVDDDQLLIITVYEVD
jgi:hypothetical protein